MRSQLSLMWLAAMTAAASAMPLDGTISTSFQPNMENGNLVGCSIIYSVLDHPEIFEKNRPNTFAGSIGIGINRENKNLELLMSTSGFASRGDFPSGVEMDPVHIDSTYIIDIDFATNLKFQHKKPQGAQGGVISWFDLVKSAEILSNSLEKRKLRIGYKTEKNDLENYFDVDLSVLDTNANGEHYRGEKTLDDFRHCNESLSRSIKLHD